MVLDYASIIGAGKTFVLHLQACNCATVPHPGGSVRRKEEGRPSESAALEPAGLSVWPRGHLSPELPRRLHLQRAQAKEHPQGALKGKEELAKAGTH